MYCKNCGKEISDGSVVCINCGAKADSEIPFNILSIVGFALSFFLAVPGLICSIIGYLQIKKSVYRGKSLAVAGIVISSVSIVITLIVIIYAISLAAIVATTYPSYPNYYY